MSAGPLPTTINSIDRFLPVADDLPAEMIEWQAEGGGHCWFKLTAFGLRSPMIYRSATKEDIKAEFDRLKAKAEPSPAPGGKVRPSAGRASGSAFRGTP